MIGDDGAPIYDSEPRSIKYLCLENHNQTSVMGYGVFCDRFNELEQWELGDINQDGGHNILDIILIIDYILGNQEFTQEQLELADMDGDGTINILDITQLINIILEDPNTTPSETKELMRQLQRLNTYR